MLPDVSFVKTLKASHCDVLSTLAAESLNGGFVPISKLRGIKAPLNLVITELLKHKLIGYAKIRDEQCYSLSLHGKDALALRSLVARSRLMRISRSIGQGKEAEIYVGCSSDSGEVYVVKAFRINNKHFCSMSARRSERSGAKKSPDMSAHMAKREYENLQLLRRLGINAPQPVARSYHMVQMSLLRGVQLRAVRTLPAEAQAELLRQVFELLARMVDARVVHGDFNEYNTLVAFGDDGLTPSCVYTLDVSCCYQLPEGAYWEEFTDAQEDVLNCMENLAAFFDKRFNSDVRTLTSWAYVLRAIGRELS